MYQQKTLVVLFCMHRSGSSLATSILQALGLSLGPFQLIGALPSNPFGHFEAVPFNRLNREVQRLAHGFEEDMPTSRKMLEEYVHRRGNWPEGVSIPCELFEEGRSLIEQLITSGDIAGFKDPRTAVVWPFWREVLNGFSQVKVIPLVLLRSPHEIAMSLFMRGCGTFEYEAALDVVAAHLYQLKQVVSSWSTRPPQVSYDPAIMRHELKIAAEACGLAWSDEAFDRLYDSGSKHHEPAVVDHEAQQLFDELRGASSGHPDAPENRSRLARDIRKRAALLYETIARFHESTAQLHESVAVLHRENQSVHERLQESERENLRLRTEVNRLRRILGEIEDHWLAGKAIRLRRSFVQFTKRLQQE